MPTTKLIYATSDSHSNFQFDNTPSNFEFIIQEPITLATPHYVLTVCFKGIYLPGKILTEGDKYPQYIKIHLDALEFQRVNNRFDQCLARFSPNPKLTSQFIELPHSKAFILLNKSISSFHVKITDEKNKIVKIQNYNNQPTILKLEVSTMNMSKQSFVISCSSHDDSNINERYTSNSFSEFRSWLTTEFNAGKHSYQVGLTAAILPKNILSCSPDFAISFQVPLSTGKKFKTINIKFTNILKVKLLSELAYIINRVLNDEQVSLFFSIEKNKFTFTSIAHRKIGQLLDKFKKKAKIVPDISNLTELSMFTSTKCSCGTPSCTCEDKIRLKVSAGLMFIYCNMNSEYEFTINKLLKSRAHLPTEIKNSEKPNMKKILPEAINIFSPIVSSTIVGREQKHLLEIIPFRQNIAHISSHSEAYVYHPTEITYHDVQKSDLKELFFKLENIDKTQKLYTESASPVTLVLHFKAI